MASISEMTPAASVAATDLIEVAVVDEQSATGYSTKSLTMGDVQDFIAEYEEVIITTLNNGSIDTSRGGCYYRRFGRIVHLHLSVKDLTEETTTNVYTMPTGYRPPYSSGMGIGIGASRDKRANVSVGASTGTCNLWSESTTALIDFVYII